jgi:hypothetical protein
VGILDVQISDVQIKKWPVYSFRFLGFCLLSKTEEISIQSALILKKIEV